MTNIKENVQNKQDWETMLAKQVMSRKVNLLKFEQPKLELILMGDEHLGSQFYDEKSHDENLEYCLDNKIPIILMGDQLETATKTSIGAGVYQQNQIIQGQLEKSVAKYLPLANEGLILGKLDGNHENRVFNTSSVNLSKIWCQLTGVPYLAVGAAFIFRVGNQSYTAYVTHGSSGARLPHTKIANIIKANQMIDSEIYAQGHVHQLSHHVQNFYKINKSTRQIDEAQKHYILTGSYLQHWGSYAHIRNMEPARIGSPKLKLSGIEHRIRVSL